MLEGIRARQAPPANLQPYAATARAGRPPQASFARMLETAIEAREPVRFSAHATERLASRGITMDSGRQARLQEAVNQAAAKGARESLVIDGDLAFVVNVPRRTVITAMPLEQMEQNIFTNIDSAVVVPQAPTPATHSTNDSNLNHGPAPAWGGPRAAER